MDAIFKKNMCNIVRGALELDKDIRVNTLYRLGVTTHVEVNSNVAMIKKS